MYNNNSIRSNFILYPNMIYFLFYGLEYLWTIVVISYIRTHKKKNRIKNKNNNKKIII